MCPIGVHRELKLPDPVRRNAVGARNWSEGRLGIATAVRHVSCLELHRHSDGTVSYGLGAPTRWALDHTFAGLLQAFPGAELGGWTECALEPFFVPPRIYLRAVPILRHHYAPLWRTWSEDFAGLLLRNLSSRALEGSNLVLQIIFQRVNDWEANFWSPAPAVTLNQLNPALQMASRERLFEAVYHVEIRAQFLGPDIGPAWDALSTWVNAWVSLEGRAWWTASRIGPRQLPKFLLALRDHDIERFAGRKVRRDLSARDLSAILPIPWKEHHPEVTYAGAPRARVPPSLAFRPDHPQGIVVGHNGNEPVQLPAGWNHLAIIGKTRSGKSTVAQNMVRQILALDPKARVIVLEPSGVLVRAILERLPPEVASDTVVFDPAHPTFSDGGVEMAAIPLNLLNPGPPPDRGISELERRAEKLSGDLLLSIKNAWGEESIGGRAEFILRAVLQGLLSVEGANLVDAYSALSDRTTLRQLENLAQGRLLRDALRVHLPKLGYQFTISSLDKVGKIATNPLLRKTLCQRYRSVPLGRLLDHRLLLLNLEKGTLGSEGSAFLGAMLLTQMWSALQERGRISAPIYLVVDEFHNYAIPAFADMLSEGARLGLHVVALTQYLGRIPEKVRSALIGNVDTWMLFTLGAEDVELGQQVVEGARFGWVPADFSGGLAPRQAALSTRGFLLKLDTYRPFDPIPDAAAVMGVVRRSSRRYAAPEDSEVSPFQVDHGHLAALNERCSDGHNGSTEELAQRLGLTETEVHAAIAIGLATGDLVREADGRVLARARGVFHAEAIGAASSAGPEHSALLADATAYLDRCGVKAWVVEQQGGYLRPDAEFGWLGRTYNVEVECSTLAKRPEQSLRNVRKALSSGRRCLVAVPDLEAARRFRSLLREAMPEVPLWNEVGVIHRDGPGRMAPYEDGGLAPWEFLDRDPGSGGEGPAVGHGETDGGAGASGPGLAPTDPHASDLARVGSIARQLRASGRTLVTAEAFGELLRAEGSGALTLRRLGMALSSLGVRSQRVMRDGIQHREYDLRSLDGVRGER